MIASIGTNHKSACIVGTDGSYPKIIAVKLNKCFIHKIVVGKTHFRFCSKSAIGHKTGFQFTAHGKLYALCSSAYSAGDPDALVGAPNITCTAVAARSSSLVKINGGKGTVYFNGRYRLV